MTIKEDTTSAIPANATGAAVDGVSPLLALVKRQKEKLPLEMLLDRCKQMKKDLTGKNPNPLNNTFSNGNSELKKNSTEAIRNTLDNEREKHRVKKLRDITKGK